MVDWVRIGRSGARHAARFRKGMGLTSKEPISIWDVVQEAGLKVRFLDVPSAEGFYLRTPGPTIAVTAHRPPGRQAFTCAHELGHHVLGHGSGADEYLAPGRRPPIVDEDELLADSFAQNLLMPSAAIRAELRRRGWSVRQLSPQNAYALAEYFGVGYATLLKHLFRALEVLGGSDYDELRRHRPKDLQAQLLGGAANPAGRVVPVDQHWTARAVDLEVGDVAILPFAVNTEGVAAVQVGIGGGRVALIAKRPGVSQVKSATSDWKVQVRVCRRTYVGLIQHRFAEDPEFDDES